jgi:hypothetical protein
MEHQIGDFVVRKHHGEVLWSMTGIISSVENNGSKTFYTIHWTHSNVVSSRWQAHEFKVIA